MARQSSRKVRNLKPVVIVLPPWPVSAVRCLNKLSWATQCVIKHELLTDCQHGFRPKRGCETQLLTLADELIKGLDKGRQLDLAILDFNKAFDCVPYEHLLKNQDHYGIQGNTLDWIREFLTDNPKSHSGESCTIVYTRQERCSTGKHAGTNTLPRLYQRPSASVKSNSLLICWWLCGIQRDTIRKRLPDSPRWPPETIVMGEVVGNVPPPSEEHRSSST